MRHPCLSLRAAVLVGTCAAGVALLGASAPPVAANSPTVWSFASATIGRATARSIPGTARRIVEVWLAGHPRAAQQFVDAVSAPGSSTYRRYLSPNAYTERFGPGAGQIRAIQSFLTRSGFASVHSSAGRDYVSAAAPPSTIDRTFSVVMGGGHDAGPGGQALTGSNESDPGIPAKLRHDILAVTGVGGVQPRADGVASMPRGDVQASRPTPRPRGADAKSDCSSYWAQHTTPIAPAFDAVTEAAIPVCGYSAGQMRSAYGLTGSDTGAGTRIALIEVGAPIEMFRTLTDYANANGLNSPRHDQYRQEAVGPDAHGGRCLNEAMTEAPEDSEALYAMAPAATQLVVDGCDTGKDYDQSLFDAELAPLTGGSRPSVAIELTSFDLGEESSVAASELKISHAIALRAAAEGVSLLVASGDQPGVEAQSSDPDVTAVGGTTLGIGPSGRREFETGWLTRFGERRGTSGPWTSEASVDIGAGGGVSEVYREPSYQCGVVPRALSERGARWLGRAIPDLAADADDYSGMLLGYIGRNPKTGRTTPYTTFRGLGTSGSTPLVAGIVADAEQRKTETLGLLNPLLYSLAGTRAFHDIRPLSPAAPQVDRAFYTPGGTDIGHKFAFGYLVGINDADGSGTHQVTAPGYDTVTGLGTPDGPAFIRALRSNTTHSPDPVAKSQPCH